MDLQQSIEKGRFLNNAFLNVDDIDLEETQNDLKDASSIYENPSYQAQARLNQLQEKLNIMGSRSRERYH